MTARLRIDSATCASAWRRRAQGGNRGVEAPWRVSPCKLLWALFQGAGEQTFSPPEPRAVSLERWGRIVLALRARGLYYGFLR